VNGNATWLYFAAIKNAMVKIELAASSPLRCSYPNCSFSFGLIVSMWQNWGVRTPASYPHFPFRRGLAAVISKVKCRVQFHWGKVLCQSADDSKKFKK